MALINRTILVIFLFAVFVPAARADDPMQLYELEGAGSFDSFSHSVAGLGDLNGDGHADFAVGAPFGSGPAGGLAGYVVIYSGATADVLYRIDGQSELDHRGWVAGLGDVNGDGTADFGVGSAANSYGINASFFGGPMAGSIKVYSGRSGLPLYEVPGSDQFQDFGREFDGIGDVNGDGKGDIVVGTAFATIGGLAEAGAIHLLSGADGSLIRRIDGSQAGDRLGFSVAGAGDVDRDGVPDIVAGAPGPAAAPHSGAVIVLGSDRGRDLPTQGRCSGGSLGLVGGRSG